MRCIYCLGIYVICIFPALGFGCEPGTYMSVTDRICQICPENYYCPGQENIEIYQSRYITVPYLESDGYSYIDTQIIPTMDKDFYFLAELPENITTAKQVVFYWVRNINVMGMSYPTYGCIYNPSYPNFIRAYRNSDGYRQISNHTSINALTDKKIEYQTDGDDFYLNGTKYEFPASKPTELVPYPIYLFALNQANSVMYQDEIQPGVKIYRWRVTQNGNVLQDMVPVYDTTTKKYGMYDIITNEFFGNANNQGDFVGLYMKNSCATETHDIAPYSPVGSKDINDCGHVLHVGNYKLYLKMKRQTSPSMVVKYGKNMFYGAMTTDVRGHLRAKYNGKIYSVFTPNID